MLVSDSLSVLWMQYLALSLVVLVAGGLGTRWLPRTLHWLLIGAVAGVCWMPWGFHETATATDDSFSGTAPAIIVAVIDMLRHRIGSALWVTLLAGAIGGALGMLIGARRSSATPSNDDHRDSRTERRPAPTSHRQRREPTL